MSGGNKNKVQKHKNKTAFKIQFNPLALEIHKKVSLKGLCKRCADQISWKMQYNKYKKMSEASKCNICLQKNVGRSYMSACEPCSQALKICPKCLDAYTEEQIEVRLNEMEQKKQDEQNERKMNEFLKTLKERSRRTVKRLFEKGTIKWSPQLNNFVDQQEKPLTLQFRQGYGDKTQNGDDDSQIDEFGSDEQGEQKKNKPSEKQKVKAIKEPLKQPQEDQNQEEQINEGSQDQLDEGNQEDQEDQEGQQQQQEQKSNEGKNKKNKPENKQVTQSKIEKDEKQQTQIISNKPQEQNEQDWCDCEQDGEDQTNQ